MLARQVEESRTHKQKSLGENVEEKQLLVEERS